MTPFDAIVADLRKLGWRVWFLGHRADGWHAILATDTQHPAIVDWDSRAKGGYSGGFSRRGRGVDPVAALRDAGKEILPLDVDAMLA